MKLAIKGGASVNKQLGEYTRWPVGSEREKKELQNILNSGKWGLGGEQNNLFTLRYTQYCSAEHGLTVSNGTIALELVLRAMGIGRGDEVIVPAYTFVASVSAIIMCGAVPVFADINPATFLIDPEDAESRITSRTKAIIGVHLGGSVFDIDKLLEICSRHNIQLIEDAAQAHGSRWKEKSVGSWGMAGGFSFQASKNLCCGEGGFVTTNSKSLYEKLWSIHHNGREYGEMGYHHPFLGTNARITEWQAAILNTRMDTLDQEITLRMENAAYLSEQLRQFPFLEPAYIDARTVRNSLHLYLIRYLPDRFLGIDREKFVEALNAENVCKADCGYTMPIYDMELMYSDAYKKLTGHLFKSHKETLPCSERAARREGMWIYHSSLLGTRKDMDHIVEAVHKISINFHELTD